LDPIRKPDIQNLSPPWAEGGKKIKERKEEKQNANQKYNVNIK